MLSRGDDGGSTGRYATCHVKGSHPRYLNQPGFKSRQNSFQVRPPESIGNLSAWRRDRCLRVRSTVSMLDCCQCVCVVIPYILEVELFFFYTPFGKLCGRTNRSRSHIGGRPHRSFLFFSFLFSCGARFSRPFPSSTVKSSFVYPRHNCSPLVGHDVRENSSSCGCVKIRTHVPYRQKVSGATGYR